MGLSAIQLDLGSLGAQGDGAGDLGRNVGHGGSSEAGGVASRIASDTTTDETRGRAGRGRRRDCGHLHRQVDPVDDQQHKQGRDNVAETAGHAMSKHVRSLGVCEVLDMGRPNEFKSRRR